VASLIAEPARARMLAALMNGQALTATELAVEAGVAPSTASAHLGRLKRAAAIMEVRQGRHRYYRLTDPDLAAVLERLMGLASQPGRRRGPVDPELRPSRVCFDHLAGAIAVQLADAFRRSGYVQGDAVWDLSPRGERFFISLGIDVPALAREKRPLVRPCLDWSERRFHLAGGLGAALLRRMFDAGWAYRESASRIVTLSEPGERWVRSVVSAEVARAG
jgi:DNA-binding transcriptional ArsR family regulator